MVIKILVVDDEPDVAVIFRQKFRRRIAAGELDFQFAANGKLGLELLESDPEISLVFSDIRMPTMDGLAFLKAIKTLDRKVLLPLVVSAYDDMPNIREAMRQGAWDFITKPMDLDDLEQVLDNALAEVRQKVLAYEALQRVSDAEQAQRLAERTKQMQQTFFENITHELRTPLTLILAPLESALGLSGEGEIAAYLLQAKRSGLILLDLVNQLLDFAKLDAEKLTPNLQALDWAQRFRNLEMAFRPLALQKEITFETVFPESLPALGDARLLTRIFLNLLSNAFKFTPFGGSVTWRLTVLGDQIHSELEDNGPGIPADKMQAVFQRFYQAHEGNGKANLGTGLGLALCKSLVEALGGEIRLTSKSGEGSRFDANFPYFAAEIDHPIEAETEGVDLVSWVFPESMDAFTDDNQIGERPLILVAEDHLDMRRYIVSLLKPHFEVEVAENGYQALVQARQSIPDLVISDWMMPEMDGMALLENLRLDRSTQHIPLIMLTAKAEVESKLEGIRTGAEAYLAKPFHPSELVAVVRNLLAMRERMRERFRLEILHPDKVKATSYEDQFAADLKKVMEKHLMDEQFGVESLADSMAMSRRTLVRKLTAMTGQAPVKFIRAYRLERGLQMLRDHGIPIWEVAVKTGFGSASYFTKCFKDHYGMSPREAMQSKTV
jgi:signal transduction histidine kinase/AraC-like DNA-binding protein